MRFSSLLCASALSAVSAASSRLSSRQSNGTTFTVNTADTHQTIDGFGFSEAFQRANLVVDLDDEKRQRVLDLFFNRTTGAGFSILRNGIGSSPNSSNDWMNTIAPVAPANASAPLNYVWDGKDSGQLWLSQQAVKYGVKTFYANAWSAPGYMKTNGQDSNGGWLCGVTGHNNCTSGNWLQSYADYLVQYVKFYQAAGVNVTHLGFLNEPDFTTTYASMLSNGQQAADFIKVLYKTLKANNLNIGINCCDNTGWKVTVNTTRDLKAAGVEDLLYAISSHPYTSALGDPLNTTAKVWETEYADLSGKWTTAWYKNGGTGEGLTWAALVHSALTRTNVNAYLYWIGTQQTAINGDVNEKLIRVDNGTYEVSKRLWAFAQWSRYVRPGAVRVGTVASPAVNSTILRTSAFKNTDGTLAVQVLNNGTSDASVSFAVQGFKGSRVAAWLTDNQNDLASVPAQIASDGIVTGTVATRGMVTFVLS